MSHFWVITDPDEGMLECADCGCYKGSQASLHPCPVHQEDQ